MGLIRVKRSCTSNTMASDVESQYTNFKLKLKDLAEFTLPFLFTIPKMFEKTVNAHLLQHLHCQSNTGTRGSSASMSGCLQGRDLSGRSRWPPCFLSPGDPCTLIAYSPWGDGGSYAYPGRKIAFNLLSRVSWHPWCCCRRALGATPSQQQERRPFQRIL